MPDADPSSAIVRVLVLGEALWDCFPDGARFGGAAANFACMVARLAGRRVHVALATAVGQDDWGLRAIDELAHAGVDTSLVALVPQPTGRVQVRWQAPGVPEYQFQTQPAWEALPWSAPLSSWAQQADVIYFGTLAQWGATSRETIRQALALSLRPGVVRVLDVNLRTPFWTDEILRDSLSLATHVKLNDEEIPIVQRVSGEAIATDPNLLTAWLLRNVWQGLAWSRGAAGSVLWDRHGSVSSRSTQVRTLVDSVGAGDAFTAAWILGIVAGWPLERCHDWATATAAWVCSQPGATPEVPQSLAWLEGP